MASHGEACAHLHVEYAPEEVEVARVVGMKMDCWKCRDCGYEFVPVARLAELTEVREKLGDAHVVLRNVWEAFEGLNELVAKRGWTRIRR
jgi:hypothetical protein